MDKFEHHNIFGSYTYYWFDLQSDYGKKVQQICCQILNFATISNWQNKINQTNFLLMKNSSREIYE